ncbi:MAG: SIS domain-containing protein [Gammaproteobacteria bacterium]|nr:SIS domain-containing protein [Gammaproteobacteria bacterium]
MLNAAPLRVTEGRYFQDVMAQPQALRATHAWLAEPGRWGQAQQFITARDWKRIVLTGMGSSYHTFHPLHLALIEAGHSPVMIETSELVHYGLALCDEHTLVIAASQSGASAETVRLLELNRRATVLGVTNTARSDLARGAGLALLAQAGPEHSVSCKTYVAGMLALQWLAALFARRDEQQTLGRLAAAAELAAEYLQGWPQHMQALAGRLRGKHHVFFTGRGSSLSAVGTGALIMKEATRLHAEGMSSAAFRHGPLEMLHPEMWIGVFAGPEPTRALNRRLVADLVANGGYCDEIGVAAGQRPFRLPDSDPVLQPILEILPVQMMTLALAALAGREAGHFERASKITDTE